MQRQTQMPHSGAQHRARSARSRAAHAHTHHAARMRARLLCGDVPTEKNQGFPERRPARCRVGGWEAGWGVVDPVQPSFSPGFLPTEFRIFQPTMLPAARVQRPPPETSLCVGPEPPTVKFDAKKLPPRSQGKCFCPLEKTPPMDT